MLMLMLLFQKKMLMLLRCFHIFRESRVAAVRKQSCCSENAEMQSVFRRSYILIGWDARWMLQSLLHKLMRQRIPEQRNSQRGSSKNWFHGAARG